MTRRDLIGSFTFLMQGNRFSAATRLISNAVDKGEVAAASLYISSKGARFVEGFGRAKEDTPFLLASISKPMTAVCVMRLVDRRSVSLDDAVRKHIPEFQGGDRNAITIRHLLTHTSGLPDMLPENEDLRKRHAPLKDFVAGACRTPLLFKPGAEVRYQSMGILLAAEIVERVAGQPFRDFARKEVFEPLGMRATSFGLGGRRIADTALCQVTENSDWNWNSPYWRDLGAPWGGAHAPAEDVARFLQYFLEPDSRVLKRETAKAMISNQTPTYKEPWGLGFMLKKPALFGKTCSERTYGHYGSTGTVAWADPTRSLICVLLTTRPAAESRAGLLGPVSDAVSDAAG